jgi:hypothetical protein
MEGGDSGLGRSWARLRLDWTDFLFRVIIKVLDPRILCPFSARDKAFVLK